ncbi:TonB-dependent siderophore receptor [Ramlibacter sp. GTP1]|uniref:TonB-dependent siderophore receptor n=2 Tax=Ramlibacter albus TaxID=2079448 RepID=A0A923MED7_9BURK|nr:TonB-dependent siderophore receptor [Ramlibacter albus]MBC5767759.1 TonB-dependent siderophore receptor [Ramlibacter albus]
MLRPVVITDRSAAPTADVTGFGDVPLKDVPVSATVIDSRSIESSGARRLADLTQFDPSVTDAYNSPGYWDFLSIRGFTLDNRFNYRREGLPVSAETSVPLDNKERVEILKGTSGIQAGTSAPGGLVNYVVKRPTENDLRKVRIEATQRASLLGAVDLGGRFGNERAFGYRINAAYEQLRPLMRNLGGERHLFAVAADWRIDRSSVLEGEFELSRRTQPSQAGFSLLGSRLPAAPDPRLNLNNQPWSLPNVFEAASGTLRYERAINTAWRWSAKLGTQQLKTDDRIAFPFGCSAENNFDRYCSDGTYDLYDFRSENEKRRQDAAAIDLKGKFATGGVQHDLGVGLLASRVRNRFQDAAFNYVGTGSVQGTLFTPADPSLTDTNTNRDERSLEFSVQDAIRFNDRLTGWLGVRHTQLDRDSVRTNGTRRSSYDQGITTPWAALSYKLTPAVTAYANWGEGVESQVVPNRPSQYTNAGVALPALKSRQWELGAKGGTDTLGWQAALFQVTRPVSNLDACARLFITPCLGAYDGDQRHRGLELTGRWSQGGLRLDGGVTLLDAERRGSTAEPATNGKRPVNVPEFVLRANTAYRIASVPGLELQGRVSHEGSRPVLPDASITLPSWTRVDAALRYERRMGSVDTTWTLGVDNLLDRRYWRESPYQFGHVYLYPGAPRTLRVGLSAAL